MSSSIKATCCANSNPILVVHGGAGDIPDSRVELKLRGLKAAARAGYQALIVKNDPEAPAHIGESCQEPSTVAKAVVAAVSVLEDDEAFNAGFGSVLNEEGEVHMDASVMEGTTLKYGAVAGIANIKNPIQVALKVMQSRHCIISGPGAIQFALKNGFEQVAPESLISDYARAALDKARKLDASATSEIGHDDKIRGTVGAVAMDTLGNMAAATSTGGITNQMKGRVGDSPIIGAGTYADQCSGAVSVTGVGECLLRSMAAKRIADNLGNGIEANKAVGDALDFMSENIGGDGGGIALSKDGQIGIEFNSRRMAWAFIRDGKLHFGCNRGEHFQEDL